MRRVVLNLRESRPIWDIPDWALEEIRRAIPQSWELVEIEAAADGRGDGGGAPEAAVDAVRDAEVYIGYGFPRQLFEAAHQGVEPRLRWVHSAAAGVGGSLYPEMRESPIVLTNSAGVHAVPMAETVIGMILHFARGFDLAAAAQRQRRWGSDAFEAADSPVREIGGATLGLLGFGGIGREISRRATALGMHVLALKRRPAEAPEGVELLFGEDGLTRILRESDFVAVTLPETGATRGIMDERRLASMKPGAVLINVGRGRTVAEAALVRALEEGRLRGAGLDVFEREPLPADSPLWEMEQVLVLPHVSATSRSFWVRETDLIVQNLGRYARGEPLRNVVDKGAGY